MSLFGSIHVAKSALSASQIGLQVVGQNMANANTPGYVRQDLVLTPAPTQRIGNLRLGLGVRVEGIVQRIDRFLEDRLRHASSDRAGAELEEQTFSQLEALIGELSDTDLSSSLSSFVSTIHEVLNQPESLAARNLVVLRGRTLTEDINRLSGRASEIYRSRNGELENSVASINRLVEDVRKLNVQISESEASDVSSSDAVGLRDRRGNALAELAELIDVRVQEQPDGSVNLFSGSDFLLFGDSTREVAVHREIVNGRETTELRIAETDAPLDLSTGRLAGLVSSRDEIVGAFLDQLDEFSSTLVFEFNKLFTSGQGLRGYSSITSQSAVSSATAALDESGLPFAPVNGSLQVIVRDRQTGLSRSYDVEVDLDGLDEDTTLETLRGALDAIDGLAAEITPDRHLKLSAESSGLEFAFNNDTSGILASLGIGTFFAGSSAGGLGINAAVVADPALFAASNSGIRGNTENAVRLAEFLERPISEADGATLSQLYGRLVGQVTESASAAKAGAEGLRTFEDSLKTQHLAITGVNLDEEAIRMLSYQRMYQASAKLITTVNELLDVLMSL